MIFKVNARRPTFDHIAHEFVGVQVAAKPGFRVRDHRREVVRIAAAVHVLNLIGTHQRLIDAAAQIRHTVDRV